MKSKSKTQTSYSVDLPISNIRRVNDPLDVKKVTVLEQNVLSIGSRPYITYAIIDSVQIGGYYSILAIEADADLISKPNIEPMLCFIPEPGTGSYHGYNVRPSIIFWKNEFWTPVYDIDPNKAKLCNHMYEGDIGDNVVFDVLIQSKVCDVPQIDLSNLRTANSLWSPFPVMHKRVVK